MERYGLRVTDVSDAGLREGAVLAAAAAGADWLAGSTELDDRPAHGPLQRTRPTGHDGGHLTTPIGSRPWERMDLPIDTEAGTRPWSPSGTARWRPALRAVTGRDRHRPGVRLRDGRHGRRSRGSRRRRPGSAIDTRSYWGFPRMHLYPGPGTDDGYGFYRYSPAFVPFLVLASALPWPVFAVGWIALLVGIYIWMAGDDKWPLLVFVPVLFEFYLGNIHLLLALAVVLGFRWPATWAFVLLTKITPGIGLWWFVVRREWRSLAIALGATGRIVDGRADRVARRLARLVRVADRDGPGHRQQPGARSRCPIRLLAALLLVTWGARTDRRWTVVVATTLALPTLWFHGLAMLVGVVALHHGQPERLAASIERVEPAPGHGLPRPAAGTHRGLTRPDTSRWSWVRGARGSRMRARRSGHQGHWRSTR